MKSIQVNKIFKEISPIYYMDENGIYSKYRRLKPDFEGFLSLVDTDYNLVKIQFEWIIATEILTGEQTRDIKQFDNKAVERCLAGKQKSSKGFVFHKYNLYEQYNNID